MRFGKQNSFNPYCVFIHFVKDVRFDESVDLALHKQRRTTATELYQILKSQRLKVSDPTMVVKVVVIAS